MKTFSTARRLAMLVGFVAIGAMPACASLGKERLAHDQVDYGRAVTTAKMRQTLANIVGLRYAETPSFLPVTQIIAAYQFDGSVNATGTGSTVGDSGVSVGAGGTLAYANHPTFTFTPTSGEEFAAGYIRPLSPALILPLAQSGVPVDLLLRIGVQSIGDLQNSAALSGPDSAGSAGFFELIHVLRRLQLKGALTVRFEKGGDGGKVFLAIDPVRQDDAAVASDSLHARELLHLPEAMREFEVVYGAVPQGSGKVRIVTRSVIGILTELGAQIEVPQAEVERRTTVPTVRLLAVETRPTIIIHVGAKAPADAYGSIAYGGQDYWIDRADFDSKFAFSVVENLIALAESGQNSKAPIVTIPAN